MTATRVIFESSTAAPFVAVLRERVAAYFRARGISDKANALMVARTVSMLGLTGGAYLLILFGGLPPLAMLGLVPSPSLCPSLKLVGTEPPSDPEQDSRHQDSRHIEHKMDWPSFSDEELEAIQAFAVAAEKRRQIERDAQPELGTDR